MDTDPLRRSAAVARAVVGGTGQAVLSAGAVAAVAALMHDAGPVPCLGWLVALSAVGWTAAALWSARTGERRPATTLAAGWWTTTFLVANSLAVTSWDLYVRMIAVLAALVVLGLRLTALAGPGRPAVAPVGVEAPGAPRVRAGGA